MPHGGYHGEVRVGNTVVQQASRPDGKGGQTGGGQYKAEGYKKSNVSNLEKIIRERDKIREMKSDPSMDTRSLAIASQAPKAIIADAQQKRIADAQRRNMLEKFQQGKSVSRSDFTGNLGDGIFGLNIGATQTNNPKLRGDLNSADYRTYMESLYDANPAMYEQLFPFSSGASIRNLSRFAPGIGTLQRLFDAGKGKVSDFFMNKGIIKDTRNDPPVGIANTNAGSAANRALNAFRYGSFNTNQQPFMTNIPTGEEIYTGANILEGAPTNIQQIKTNKKEPEMMYANLNPYALTPEQIINRSRII